MRHKGELEVTCKICRRVFHVSHRYRYSYCSDRCRLIGKAIVHRDYARNNQEHLRGYSRRWRHGVWGASSRRIGAAAELYALKKLLPLLGYKDIFHVSPIRRFVPFDFVATREGTRFLIDVTTSMNRGGAWNRTALELAKALRMPFVRVFIKPDFTGYMVRDAFDGGNVLLSRVKSLPQ